MLPSVLNSKLESCGSLVCVCSITETSIAQLSLAQLKTAVNSFAAVSPSWQMAGLHSRTNPDDPKATQAPRTVCGHMEKHESQSSIMLNHVQRICNAHADRGRLGDELGGRCEAVVHGGVGQVGCNTHRITVRMPGRRWAKVQT